MHKSAVAGTEQMASARHSWRGRAGRSAWRTRTRTSVSEPVWVSVGMSQRRWLKVKRAVYKVFWRPKRNWWGGIRKRLSRRGWRRTVHWPIKSSCGNRNSWLYLWRGRLSWWNSRGVIIRSHSSLNKTKRHVSSLWKNM